MEARSCAGMSHVSLALPDDSSDDGITASRLRLRGPRRPCPAGRAKRTRSSTWCDRSASVARANFTVGTPVSVGFFGRGRARGAAEVLQSSGLWRGSCQDDRRARTNGSFTEDLRAQSQVSFSTPPPPERKWLNAPGRHPARRAAWRRASTGACRAAARCCRTDRRSACRRSRESHHRWRGRSARGRRGQGTWSWRR